MDTEPTREWVESLLEASEKALQQQPKESSILAQQALEAALKLELADLIALSQLNLGTAHMWLSEYPQAISTLLIALELAESLALSSQVATCENNLGVCFTQLGDSNTALQHYVRALELRRTLGEYHALAKTLHNLGIERRHLGDPRGAQPFFEEALALDRQSGDRMGEGRTLLSLGVVYFVLEDYAQARDFYKQALEIADEVQDLPVQLQGLQNLATLELKQGFPQQALEHYQRVYELVCQTGHRSTEASTLGGMGTALLTLERFSEAKQVLEQGLTLSEELGTRRISMELHQVLSMLARSQQDPWQALLHFEHFHELERELLNEESERHAQAIAARFELERAKQQTELERLRNVELAAALHKLEQQTYELERLAREDGLTGLLNRRSLDATLDHLFNEAQASAEPLSVVLADIDHFKHINDTFSHAMGDEVLRRVSHLMKTRCPLGGVVARYGGEEFALVLPRHSNSQAAEVCEALRQEVIASNWRELHPELKVTLSFGVCDAVHLAHHERMMAAADVQLYRSKREGRNRVSYERA